MDTIETRHFSHYLFVIFFSILISLFGTHLYALTLEEIEKKEKELQQQKEALLKQKQTEDNSPKGTRKISILKDKIGKLVEENQSEKSTVKDQVKAFMEKVKRDNPNFNTEQLDRMQHAYEDTLIEDNTTKKIPASQALNTKTLPDLKINQSTVQSQASLGQNMKALIQKKTKKQKPSTNKELSKEAQKTLISLVVKPGDTLSDIARRNYGDSSMYMAIFDANKDKLTNPHTIPKGITLRVPVLEEAKKFKSTDTRKYAPPAKKKKAATTKNESHKKRDTSYDKWLQKQEKIRKDSLRRWNEQQARKKQQAINKPVAKQSNTNTKKEPKKSQSSFLDDEDYDY